MFAAIVVLGYQRRWLPSGYVPWVLGVLSLIGACAVAVMPSKRPWLRISMTLLYLVACPFVLLILGLTVACANGDCL